MQKLFTTIWILLIACLLCLIVNFTANEAMIKNYNAGIFTENKLALPGFSESYISYYNEGNVYYRKGDFNAAIEAYQNALERHPSQYKECMIRINLALAMVTPMDPAEMTDSDIADAIQILEDAKQILCADGCAAENGNGHNKDAQTLKEDIDRFEEELKKRQENQSESSTDDKESEQKPEQNAEDVQDIQKQLEEIQKQSNEERNQNLSEIEHLDNFDFYDGETW